MTGLRSIVIKFAAFAAVSAVLLVMLVNTMSNGVPGSTRAYTAAFRDVSGLRVGDDVKAAGVRIGQVTAIDATEDGARVEMEVQDDQPLLDNTRIVMRYQNLLGQRYLGLEQPTRRGSELKDGAQIPSDRTDPGFDLTALLNGFRPLFRVLQPQDVNQLATSVVKVLQGESGTVESLLTQTTELTTFLADRDAVIGEVTANLQPVLDNLTEQDEQITSTVRELKALMQGLAKDRESIGDSIDGVSRLVGATSSLLREVKAPVVRATNDFVDVADMLQSSREGLRKALPAFTKIFGALGRATSYENALNVYICSFAIAIGDSVAINPAGNDGPWSEVCR